MSPPVTAVPSADRLPPRVDVAIVGAGMAGTSAAWWLAKRGLAVALFEKGVVSGEQSSRNWGWCRQQHRDLRELPLAMKSLELWGDLSAELGEETGFRRSGLVYVTTKKDDFATWAEWTERAQAFQMRSRPLTAAEAKEMTPGSTGDWIGGIHSPTDGRAEPGLAVPALARAAQARGGSIHQNCAVRGLDLAAGRVAGVLTEKGRVAADRVLLAGGAWSSLFCRRHDLRLPQAGVYATSFATEVAPEVASGGLSMPDVTIRRRLDGAYTVGLSGRGRVALSPQGLIYARDFWPTYKQRRASVTLGVASPFFDGPEGLARWSMDSETPFERERILDPEPDPMLIAQGLAALGRHYPSLKGIKVGHSWGGLIDSTPDGIPVISGVDALPGLFISTGYTGHGFGIGPGAGRLAADLVAGDPPLVDPAPYRYSRMTDGTDLGAPGLF
ncbi:MAG: FAD-binding oxidoreductase [Alphaproteobacteria bacterium]|nr:FAD-binding oxidoreductase [Alphaproteobacteria bacterium]